MTTIPLKTCTKCHHEYPDTTEYFHRHGTKLHPWCKPCRKGIAAQRYLSDPTILERNQAWRDANRDKVAAQSRRYQREHADQARENSRRWLAENPGKNTEYMARWRDKHREQYRESDRAYRAATREQVRARANEARQRDPERFIAYQAKRRTRALATGDYTAGDVRRQRERQGNHCRWCSQPLTGKVHIDHLIPIARGGVNTAANIVIACQSCNSRKSKLLPCIEWHPPCPLVY